eukprot:Gregarina_sp_Poly_1__2007@NODE_1527_length_3924_cov_82_479907_g1010_i0_p3_GENE_NODE_1527_length_3924_cov_82_479907_g1010_i0NODE_1527_length_3924_cov_82_479907_g1010_i0_p3_ORF_typecomplete_len217_score12_05_NODE_1527_length_3924_cov_82_479907_g1010_i029133563
MVSFACATDPFCKAQRAPRKSRQKENSVRDATIQNAVQGLHLVGKPRCFGCGCQIGGPSSGRFCGSCAQVPKVKTFFSHSVANEVIEHFLQLGIDGIQPEHLLVTRVLLAIRDVTEAPLCPLTVALPTLTLHKVLLEWFNDKRIVVQLLELRERGQFEDVVILCKRLREPWIAGLFVNRTWDRSLVLKLVGNLAPQVTQKRRSWPPATASWMISQL